VFVSLRGEFLHLGGHLINGDGFQRDVVHIPCDETSFPRKEDQVTPSLGTSSASSTNTVDIDVGRRWNTNLDDPRHSWVVDTSSRDIAGHQDGCASFLGPETVRSPGTLILAFLGVDLIEISVTTSWEGSLGQFAQKCVEQPRHVGGREENDGFRELGVSELVVGN